MTPKRPRAAVPLTAALAVATGLGLAACGATGTPASAPATSSATATAPTAPTAPTGSPSTGSTATASAAPPQGPAADRAYALDGTWSYGEEVHVGAAAVRLTTVRELIQTSVGVVVRHDAAREPLATTLVRPDGTIAPLTLPRTATHADGDPRQPRIAWVVLDDGVVTVHVHDVLEDRELWKGSVRVPGSKDEGQSITVELDGDTVATTVGDGTRRAQWDWRRDGRPVLREGRSLGLRAGRALVQDSDDAWSVRDARTDRVLRTGRFTFMPPSLSPDGRTVLVPVYDGDDAGVHVVDVASGADRTLAPFGSNTGWTVGGRLLGTVQENQVLRRCDVAGACRTQVVPLSDELGPYFLVGDHLEQG